MKANKTTPGRSGGNLGRKSKSTFVTKSGQTIKINRSLGGRIKAKRAQYAQKRAERLIGMPKDRLRRILFILHPKRQFKYWFSRDGGIMALKITGIGTLAVFLLLVGIFAYFRKDLPNIRDVSGNNIGGSIQYYDRTGQTLLWEDYDAVKRIPIKGQDISSHIKKATVAVEDKDFFKHSGFDVRGILRAGVNNAFGTSGGTQGGSTITQQLVKLTQDWNKDRTIARKIKEVILSTALEREYSKEDILTGYLNTAPYGSIDYGVEAASRDYFNKAAKDLTLDEAAMLAAIPKSPSYYSPYNKAGFNKEALIGRKDYILNLMLEQGMINAKERDEAKKVDVLAKIQERKPRYAGIQSPWFVLTAKSALEHQFGDKIVKQGGWKVTTTLDLNAQRIAEEQVQKGLVQVRRQGGDTAAFVAEDVKTGQVVALVGGDDFTNPEFGQNNYAHELELPPGSAFKPFDYAALIDTQKNAGAGSVLFDAKGPVPGYPCTTGATRTGNCLINYDLRYPGPLTLRYALGGSRNVPAVKSMLITGVEPTIAVAHKLMTNYGADGKPDPTIGNYSCYYDEKNTQKAPCYASAAIGDGAYLRLDELVHGFATLSRNGLNIPKTYVLKIQDASGKTRNEWKPSKGTQAINPESAYIVTDILSDPRPSYFPNKIHRYKDHKFALKTGTTNDSKDGLLMMYSTQYAAGTWVGYHNRQRVMSGFMETMTTPIVNNWMKAMHDNAKAEDWVKPVGIQSLPAFVVRNHVGVGSIEPSPANDLFPSWYKQPTRASNQAQKIDSVSNKIATECTPPRAIKQVTNADSNTFSIDKFVTGANAVNTAEKDDIHKCDDAKPRITLDSQGFACNGSCLISAHVTQGTHPISSDQFKGTVNFLIDGQVVNSQNIGGEGGVSFTYTPDATGQKSLTAEIIDSVLYDGSDTTTITTATASAAPTPAALKIDSAKKTNGNNAKFKWTGGVVAVSIFKVSDNSLVCAGAPSGECTGSAPVGTPVYAKDSNTTSDPVTVEN